MFSRRTLWAPVYERRKIEMANQIMAELHTGRLCQSREDRKMPLLTAMENAREEILAYINENQVALRIDLETALVDFEKYFEAIKQNLILLRDGIYARHDELSRPVKVRPEW